MLISIFKSLFNSRGSKAFWTDKNLIQSSKAFFPLFNKEKTLFPQSNKILLSFSIIFYLIISIFSIIDIGFILILFIYSNNW